MKEVELLLVNSSESCTAYTIKFINDELSEFEKFMAKFRNDAVLREDYLKIMRFVEQIFVNGAIERYFRREGKMKDSVAALPVLEHSKLRLYCLRLTDKILILGNGDIKTTRTYQEDSNLEGYVIDLQNFEKILKQEVLAGNVEISEKEIKTDNTFKI